MLARHKFLYEILNNKISQLDIEYVLRFKIFYEYKFYLSYPLLIPRNDTQVLLLLYFKIYSKIFTASFVDAGCGVGSIGISINKSVKSLKSLFLDINPLNIKLLTFNLKFDLKFSRSLCNWHYLLFSRSKFNVFISNPPYISFSDFSYYYFENNSEFINILESSHKGFFDIYRILNSSYEIILNNGIILIEHSYSQSKNLRKIMNYYGFNNIYSCFDFNKLSRVTYAEK